MEKILENSRLEESRVSLPPVGGRS